MSKKLDLGALKNIDFSKVLGHLKRRWILIVCGLVVLVAPVSIWFLQGMLLQEPIDAEMKVRSKLLETLGPLKQGAVSIRMPDGSMKEENAAINEAIISRIRDHNEALGKNAEAFYVEAVRRNRADHVFLPGMEAYLPKPVREDEATREILMQKWEQIVRPAQLQLTSDPVFAGPVPASELVARVQGAEQQFLAANRITKRAEVPAAELPKLTELLRRARIEGAVDHASGLQFYLDRGAIRWQLKPSSKTEGAAAVDDVLRFLYREQWDLWLVNDLFKAFRNLNARAPGGPLKSPIKRVMEIRMADYPPRAAESQSAAQADAGEAGEAIDPQKEVQPDFKAGGLLGLVSNQLYDVRETKVKLVMETAFLPALVNELAKVNFISVDDVALRPADPFEALRQGYVYGPQPCSEVELTLKSVWLRDWTTERMPVAMLKAIKSAGKPKPESTEPADAAKPAAAGN